MADVMILFDFPAQLIELVQQHKKDANAQLDGRVAVTVIAQSTKTKTERKYDDKKLSHGA